MLRPLPCTLTKEHKKDYFPRAVERSNVAMSRLRLLFFSLSLLCLVWCRHGYAATRNVSCSGDISSALQTAMTASADGDVVSIGAGSCTLSSSVSAACSSWILQGAGSSSTTVTVNGGNITLAGCNGKSFRITGINFIDTLPYNSAGIIYVWQGTGISFRVDHNIFNASAGWQRYMLINEPCTSPGCVFDHNTITDAGGLVGAEANPTDGSYSGCSGSPDNCAGQTMWIQPMVFDNGSEVYFENNTFTFNNYYGNDMMDCDDGGRYVF